MCEQAMHLSDFDYDLPQELVAQRPLPARTESRLLCLDGSSGEFQDRQFRDLTKLLRANDLLVVNDTRVMNARLAGFKETGGRIEVLVERVLDPHLALAHIRASKPPRPESRVFVGAERVELSIRQRRGELFEVVSPGEEWNALMARIGVLPLPPYVVREPDAADAERYQTVYAHRTGAVAAPTAGLHFDAPLLAALDGLGVKTARVTLHVGAGTFQPVRYEDLDRHVMHCEYAEVEAAVCEAVLQAKAQGGRVVAVGTTSVRSLESAAVSGFLAPFRGDTQLFIRPGYRFRVVDAMVTNFHLPKSTLLMLVTAFAGFDNVLRAYRHAVETRYRFFSYGDAMFLTRKA